MDVTMKANLTMLAANGPLHCRAEDVCGTRLCILGIVRLSLGGT